MKLPQACLEILLNADGKALATTDGDNIHVIPVSSIRVVEDKIQLVNYFFGQTLKNIQANQNVSLAVWKGLEGYQVKANAYHYTEGDEFESVKKWIGAVLPKRIVKGVLILEPIKVLDVSADANRAGRVVMQ